MAQAAQNMDVLSNLDNIKILSNVLKTNVSACTSIGSFYLPQVGRVFLDMLGLYKAVSGIISETVAREGSWFSHPNPFLCRCSSPIIRHYCH
jgi:exportin-1